jgi:hypothetical protein
LAFLLFGGKSRSTPEVMHKVKGMMIHLLMKRDWGKVTILNKVSRKTPAHAKKYHQGLLSCND